MNLPRLDLDEVRDLMRNESPRLEIQRAVIADQERYATRLRERFDLTEAEYRETMRRIVTYGTAIEWRSS